MRWLYSVLLLIVVMLPLAVAQAQPGGPAPGYNPPAQNPGSSTPTGQTPPAGNNNSGPAQAPTNCTATGTMGVINGSTGTRMQPNRGRSEICPCSPGMFVEKLVHCFASKEGIIFKSVMSFITGTKPYFQAIFSAAVLLATMIFGYKLATGTVRQIGKDTMTLLFKIIAVTVFLLNFETIYEYVIDLMYSLGFMAAELIVGYGELCRNSSGPGTVEAPAIWAQYDCALNYFLSFKGGGPIILGSSAMIVGLIFAGGYGFAIAMMLVGVIMTLMLAIMRTVYIYLSSILSVSFLMLLGPIFVPLMLFRSRTDQFNKWVLMIFMHLFIPMFLYIVMALILVMLKYGLFVGEHALFSGFAGKTVTQPAEFGLAVNDFGIYETTTVEIARNKTDSSVASTDPNANSQAPVSQSKTGRQLESTVLPQANTTVPIELAQQRVNLERMSQNSNKSRADYFTGLLGSLMGAILLVYIAYILISETPSIVNKMVNQGVSGQYVTQNQMLGQGAMEKGASALRETGGRIREAQKRARAQGGRLGGKGRAGIIGEVAMGMMDAKTGGLASAIKNTVKKSK
jgi:type IV secretory pathway VirB6-like protein